MDYYFLSRKEFHHKIKRGEFLEWAQVYDHYYGTPKKQVLANLSQGVNVLLDIDMQGALNIKKCFPGALLIFILPPSLEILRQRLINRKKDSVTVINRRMKQIEKELKYIPRYDLLVINDDLKRTVKSIREKIINTN